MDKLDQLLFKGQLIGINIVDFNLHKDSICICLGSNESGESDYFVVFNEKHTQACIELAGDWLDLCIKYNSECARHDLGFTFRYGYPIITDKDGSTLLEPELDQSEIHDHVKQALDNKRDRRIMC